MTAPPSRRTWTVPTGLFIRDFLKENMEGYAYEVWKALKETREKNNIIAPQYRCFWNQWRILQELDLIRLVRVEKGFGKYPRRYFSIAPNMENDRSWTHPQMALYPLTQLGAEDYKNIKIEARKKGISIGALYVSRYPERVTELSKELSIPRHQLETAIKTFGRAKK